MVLGKIKTVLGKTTSEKEELSRAIETIVTELGYECVNVALVTEEGRPVLRVMIDSLGGINVGDCEVVSKSVNRYLDGKDARGAGDWNDRYYLEVTSPGLERPLFTSGDYERFRGKEVRIKTHALVDGRKTHVGIIETSDDTSVILKVEEGTRRVPFDDVARATLVFRGLEPQEPKKKPGTQKSSGKQKAVDKKCGVRRLPA
ncbi:MAG: ribosome maturation factor RimP [Synergistaceae bacterium]|nr:ribosome maturation factor RimP [Synergistaceae bacterium]